MKKYNQPPIQLDGLFDIEVKEMMYYQYLPIKMSGDNNVMVPFRLRVFDNIISTCIADAIKIAPNRSMWVKERYIYLTAKHMFVSPGTNLNRLGWHSDGFGTDDISYVWSNCLPTLWTDGRPSPPNDDIAALSYFNANNDIPVYETEPNRIYKLDQYVVHACAVTDKPVLRSFVKINFSRDKYNLEGNSHNYLLDYNWEMKKRKQERNHPQSNISNNV